MQRRLAVRPRTTLLLLGLVLPGMTMAVRTLAAELAAGAQEGRQSEINEYTRYELLGPETSSFRISYEVTATAAGAKFFYNPIRKGSTASDESAIDLMTGQKLPWEMVSGTEAKKDPLMAEAEAATNYLKVTLGRPVPADGQARLLILKTYQDAKSYHREGDTLVFSRSLGIKRNSIVLPPGYQLVGSNVPSQILLESDGRIAVSFVNAGPGEAPLLLKARPGAPTGPLAAGHPAKETKSWEAPFEGETERQRLSERAHQDRDIVYFLEQPETHAFRLYHDYTESRPGTDRYLNVVRTGSKVSDPSAYVLDTGEKLTAQTMTGAELASAKIDA